MALTTYARDEIQDLDVESEDLVDTFEEHTAPVTKPILDQTVGVLSRFLKSEISDFTMALGL